MLEAIELDNIKFSESNSENHILVEYSPDTTILPIEDSGPHMAGFLDRDEVITLHLWLTSWLVTHR